MREGDRLACIDLAVLQPDELEVVGQQNVLRQLLVASDLIGLENLIEVLANGLVLDVTEDHAVFCGLEIGSSLAADFPRLVNDPDLRVGLLRGCLQQRLKCAAIRKFGLVVAILAQRMEIYLEDVMHRIRSVATYVVTL